MKFWPFGPSPSADHIIDSIRELGEIVAPSADYFCPACGNTVIRLPVSTYACSNEHEPVLMEQVR